MKLQWFGLGVLVLAGGVARAQTPGGNDAAGAPAPRATQMSGYAGHALADGQSAAAAVLANQALRADPLNAWAHYRRAGALSDLHRVDEAVAEFKAAEGLFGGADERGQSLAIYGRANALARAERCAEAKPAFEEYARFVEKKDPQSAALARGYARDCRAKK